MRHTRPEVAPGVCYGRLDLDVATSFAEEAQAALARVPPVEAVVSSPLTRCRVLAERIAEARGLALTFDTDLQEMDFGAWEGRAWSAIPPAELDAWAADFLHARPHGGESVAALRARVRAALTAHARAGAATLIVTHAGVIKAALAGGDAPQDFAAAIDFGALVALDPAALTGAAGPVSPR